MSKKLKTRSLIMLAVVMIASICIQLIPFAANTVHADIEPVTTQKIEYYGRIVDSASYGKQLLVDVYVFGDEFIGLETTIGVQADKLTLSRISTNNPSIVDYETHCWQWGADTSYFDGEDTYTYGRLSSADTTFYNDGAYLYNGKNYNMVTMAWSQGTGNPPSFFSDKFIEKRLDAKTVKRHVGTTSFNITNNEVGEDFDPSWVKIIPHNSIIGCSSPTGAYLETNDGSEYNTQYHLSASDLIFSGALEPRRTIDYIEVMTPPDRTDYLHGQEIDLSGLELAIYYDDEELPNPEIIEYDEEILLDNPRIYLISGDPAEFDGDDEVTVEFRRFEESAGRFTDTFDITVADYVIDIDVIVPITEYEYNDELDLTGAKIKRYWASGAEDEEGDYLDLTLDMIEENTYDKTELGPQTVGVIFVQELDEQYVEYLDEQYAELTGSFEVNVDKATPEYTAPTGLTATYGDLLSSVSLGTGFSWEATSGTLVGPYGVNDFTVKYTPTDTVHYNVVENIPVTVTVAKRAITVTADNLDKVYGEEDETLTWEITSGSLVSPDTKSALGVSLSREEGEDVDEYAITGTGTSSNYTVTVTAGTYEITPREIEITIANKSSVYGASSLADLTWTITEGELQFDDEEEDLNVELSKAAGSTVAGSPYAITGTWDNSNYDVTFKDGEYTITAKPITVVIANKSSVYGETEEVLTSSLKAGSTLASPDVYGDLEIELTKEEGSTVAGSPYAITGTWDNSNYEVTFEDGEYTITAKAITVVIADKSSVYGKTEVALTSSLKAGSTLVSPDVYEDLEIELTKAPGNTVLGSPYAITGTWDNSNYDVTFENGKYTITKATPIPPEIEELTAVVGDTLEDVIGLPEGYSWDQNVATVLEEDGEITGYTVTYTHPTDPDNYETIPGIPVTIMVNGYAYIKGEVKSLWTSVEHTYIRIYEKGTLTESNVNTLNIIESVLYPTNRASLTPLYEAETEDDGTFNIEVLPGEYDILIDKEGYLDYAITEALVEAADILDLGLMDIRKLAGDTNKDGRINMTDVNAVAGNYNKSKGNAGYSASLDFYGYEMVNMANLNITTGSSYNKDGLRIVIKLEEYLGI